MTISLAVPDILIARARSGDLDALEALYRAFETPVYNLALRVLRSPEDAEDALQETFLEVVRSIGQYRGEGHLWGWIRQIAASKALMRIRRNQVRETEALHEESAAASGGSETGARDVARRGVAARRRGLHTRGDRGADGQDGELFEVAAGARTRAAAADAGWRRSGTMMHCTMEDLLALQGGEGSVWARQHVDACAACRTELEALYQRVAQLKALPARRPARDRWPAVRGATLAERRRRRGRWGLWALAAAAGVGGLLVLRPIWTNRLDAAELARVKQQSATLERELGRFDPDARVTSGRSAALAAALEDRIAVIDGELARLGAPQAPVGSADLVNLWQQRVDLMQQLVRVRVTRAAYVGL